MKLLRAATLVVPDPAATAARYVEWLNYSIVEDGVVPAGLAAAWGAPGSAGRRCLVCRPASDADVFLRFIAGETPPDYRPLRTWGWAAIEICVQDVLAVEARMTASPFRIIGPPRELDGMPAIFPMQVRGPDQEIVYLTQIRDDLPSCDLPRAEAPIDRLFILVLACSDLRASLDWFEHTVRLSAGPVMEIVYTMLADAFDLPVSDKHAIATLMHGRDAFLELDQYPPAATARPGQAGELPPGIALCTLIHPAFGAIDSWTSPPALRDGVVYGGRRSGVLQGPDGVLVEVVEA